MDLNDDGFQDIITGQYHPGEISWFRGSAEGFMPRVALEQHGDPSASGRGDGSNAEDFSYWNYSTASFGDFDGDGDYDLIVGGSALRISENVGSRTEPRFARRELLLDIEGRPLVTRAVSETEKENAKKFGRPLPPSGSSKTSPFVVDWDNDGVLDILATDDYRSDQSMAVTFFRGVRTTDGHRFEPGVDLLKTADGSKALPGSAHRIFVCDWNEDGVKDLVIGASVVTVRGKFHEKYSWKFEDETEIESAGKDPGHPPTPDMHPGKLEDFLANEKKRWEERGLDYDEELATKQYQSQLEWYEGLLRDLSDPETPDEKIYRHQGRVYVLLGQPSIVLDRGITDEAKEILEDAREKLSAEEMQDLGNQFGDEQTAASEPLTFSVDELPGVRAGETIDVLVNINVDEGWFIYAPTGVNERQGMKETIISLELPEGFETKNNIQTPEPQAKGSFQILRGEKIEMLQQVKVGEQVEPGQYTVSGKIQYQVCNKDMCQPPRTEEFTVTLNVK